MIGLAFGAHLMATALVAGALFFAAVLPRNPSGAASDPHWLGDILMRHIALGLVASAITGLLWLWLVASEISGLPWINAAGVIPRVLISTHFGHVWLGRIAVMAVLGILFAGIRPAASQLFKIGAAIFGPILLVSLAATGHAVDKRGGMIVQGVHLLAAGIWFGGLWALRLALLSTADTVFAYEATARFSSIALFAVGALAVSGLMNALVHTPHPGMLLGSAYGAFLIGKTVLFAVALVFAAVNRWRLVPQLAGAAPQGSAHLWLVRSIAIEAAFVAAVLLMAAFVATTPPPHH